MNDLSDEAICEYANSKLTDKYDQYQQTYADGVEHGMMECRRRATEKLATWMIDHSIATGHGDAIDDLLKELEWQLKELKDLANRPDFLNQNNKL